MKMIAGSMLNRPAEADLHDALNIGCSAEQTGHVLQRDREGEDEDSRNHCVEALDRAGHCVLEGGNAAADQVDDGEHQCNERAPGQADEGVRVGEGCRRSRRCTRRFRIPEAAGVDEADDARDDEDDDGDEQVHTRPRCRGAGNLLVVAEVTPSVLPLRSLCSASLSKPDIGP